jgi:hypothetical protein
LKLDRRDEGAFAERCRQMRTRLADRAPALAGGSATGPLSASGDGDGSSQAVIAGFSQPSRLFRSFPSFQVFRAPKMTCEADEDNRNRRHGDRNQSVVLVPRAFQMWSESNAHRQSPGARVAQKGPAG